MPLYEMTSDSFRIVAEGSFADRRVRERGDLQRLLRTQINEFYEFWGPHLTTSAEEVRTCPGDSRTAEVIALKLQAFRDRGIRYLFPHCCPMDKRGHLPRIDDDSTTRLLARRFLSSNRWIGGAIDTVDLSSGSQRDPWTSEVRELVRKYDFPGVCEHRNARAR